MAAFFQSMSLLLPLVLLLLRLTASAGDGHDASVNEESHLDVDNEEALSDASGSFQLPEKRDPKDSCWSRTEQAFFYMRDRDGRPPPRPSSFLRKRMASFRLMQRRCVRHVRDWRAFFNNQDDGWDATVTSPETCKYLLYLEPKFHGVGNRIMGLVSAIVYALLTNRAIILAPNSFLASTLCNPFPRSQWTIPQEDFEFIQSNVTQSIAFNQGRVVGWGGHAVKLHLSWDSQDHYWRMFCDNEQQAMATAPWASLYTDFYLVPHWYLATSFQKPLDALFPDRRAFTHLARLFLLPANHLWEQIVRVHHSYLARVSATVGIQIRAFEETEEDLMVNVFDCLLSVSKKVPEAIPTPLSSNTPASSTNNSEATQDASWKFHGGKSIAVFVASLNPSHADKLRHYFIRHRLVDGATVAVHSISGEGTEKQEDSSHYEKALVEMWVLSLCDSLLVTDTSTFGYVSAGLAGVTPFTMNVAKWRHTDWRTNGRPSCQLSTSEPCFMHLPPGGALKCDGERDIKPYEDVPALQACPALNNGMTVRIVDTEESGDSQQHASGGP